MVQFADEFLVSAPPHKVMELLTDVNFVLSCVPGATYCGQDENGKHKATITVSFGPRRFKFTGQFDYQYDLKQRSGRILGGAAASARQATVSAETHFQVLPKCQDETSSIVRISSEAKMYGVLAQFASIGGAALARQLMNDFARNMEESIPQGAPQKVHTERKRSLSIWSILLNALQRLFSRI